MLLAIDPELFEWVVFPIIIFCARMSDVTLGTLRIILISRGKRKLVPFVGFFEVLIWVVAISQLIGHLSNVLCYVAWAGGFATGCFIGMGIEARLALGHQVIRIITHHDCAEFIEALKRANHGFTVFDGQGAKGPIKMILTVVERKVVNDVAALISRYLPDSFFSTEDIREAGKGVFSESSRRRMDFARILLPLRKAK